ncbi:altronate hydrolase [Escherichia coli]|nr:altronate hydrolase [Escherichia coli]GHK85066.1 altronate hydrolase [Escherichia coli]GHL47692.1 altronate hydrolase [Escherichia coli]
MQYIKIHALDNVAVALADLAEGTEVSVDNQTVTLRQDVARGHKFALTDIAKGANVIKYGLPIGYALADIAAGEHVHAHNTRTNLSDLDQYRYQPDFQDLPAQAADREVQIYRRANGDVGVRNELWILPTVGCVNGIARQIQNRFLKETNNAEGTDGVFLFSHTYGCSQLGDDHINTRTMLQNMVRHPNAGAVLVIGLGCENNQVTAFRETLGDIDPERVHFMICQQQDDEIEAGIEHLHQLYNVMRNDKREPGKLSELKFGLECGGSDGLSGITANPMLGRFSDYVIANGGTTVLTEVPEMFGAEQLLMDHCRDEATFEKLVTMVNDFKQYFIAHDQPIYENPSPGNKAGGITTLEDKSLGCTQKAGSSVVVDVLRYGERLKTPGLNLLSAPGNDAVATSARRVRAAIWCCSVLVVARRMVDLCRR